MYHVLGQIPTPSLMMIRGFKQVPLTSGDNTRPSLCNHLFYNPNALRVSTTRISPSVFAWNNDVKRFNGGATSAFYMGGRGEGMVIEFTPCTQCVHRSCQFYCFAKQV